MSDHARVAVKGILCPACGAQNVKITKTIQQAHLVQDNIGLTMAPRKNYMACKSCGAEWYAENFQFVYFKQKRKKQFTNFKINFMPQVKVDEKVDFSKLNGLVTEEEQLAILDVLRREEE